MKRIIKIIEKFYSYRPATIFIILIGLVTIFSVFSPNHTFLNLKVITSILRITPILGIVSIGVTILMICGEFDLSVGSILAFCSMIMAILFSNGMNVFLAAFIALIIGAFVGMLNGIITVKFGIPSFITTLGMMMILRGVVLLLSEGMPISFHPEQKHHIFSSIFVGNILGIPMQFIWFLRVAFLFWIVLEHHKFGNWVYATGGNKEAARAMGIPTNKTKIICFIIVGILCAFSGIIETTRIYSSYPLQAEGMNLLAISATVIGGTALSGGVGTIIGTVCGAILIQVIDTGLLLLRAPAFWFRTFIGMLIILVVIINKYLRRR